MHADARLIHTSLIPLRWGDMDALNHVNNTIYFRFMEQTRIDWLLGSGHVTSNSVDSPVIVTASCQFLKPMTYPATVVVKLFAGPPGRSSVHTWYEIGVEGEEEVYALGEARVVWVAAGSGKSVPLPDWVRAQLPAKEGHDE